MAWSNLSLRKKLLLPIALVGVLMLILSSFQISTLHRISAEYSSINDVYIPAIDLTLNAARDMYQAQIAERTIAFGLQTPTFLTMHSENLQQVASRVGKIQQAPVSEEAKRLAQDFLLEFERWRPRTEQMVRDTVNGRLSEEEA